MRGAAFLVLVLIAALCLSEPIPREQVGPWPGGGFLLNSGWRIQPAGTQVPLDTFPMSSALSPDGQFLLALNGGYNPPSISVLDLAATQETSRVSVPDGWLGLAFTAKGDRVYVGGGSQAAVFEFTFSRGRLALSRTFPVVAAEKRTHRDFIGDVAFSPGGRLLYAADLYHDSIVVINPQSGMVIERFQTGRRPYRILFHPDGKSFFVSSWADGAVYHHQTDDGHVLLRLRLGPHPTDMVWRPGRPASADAEAIPSRLFVAAANTNNVYVVGVSADQDLRLVETINVALTPRQPAGMTPSALALSADLQRLFVVCSDANALAVADVSEPRSALLGFIPTGWYPTAVRSLKDGRLVVLNGRGLRSYPNLTRQTGTAAFIRRFTDEELEEYSKTVLANTPYSDAKLDDAGTGKGNPVPSRPGDPSPIQHVLYIVKQNCTYDQVFGDLKEGNGDRSLVRFGEPAGPNHRKLAREFVLFDNFYVNAEAGADGQHWSAAAIAPDYVQKLWPNSYGGRRKDYDYEGQEPAAVPPAGYLWTNAAAAGLSMRNYGHFVTNGPKADAGGIQVAAVRDSVLNRVSNLYYRGFDPDYPDVERAKVFLKDLAEFEKTGQMPRLILMRLGNDHTSGTAAGKIAPLSAFADNDYALGLIVEAVSRSVFWPKTAIFVLEDDAQDGADHVDSHRSVAFLLSPYAKRRFVDSAMYNTTSMLRTIELILGLRPMTHFDAAARPMSAAFQATPDLGPYTAEKPRISLEERNRAEAPAAPVRSIFGG